MSLNGRFAGRGMANPPQPASAGPASQHPATSELVFTAPNVGPEAEPLNPVSGFVGSAGLGREYLPIPEEHRAAPGQITPQYGGGFADISGVHPNGFVDRTRLEGGLYYLWTDELVKMPVSAKPFITTGLVEDSLLGQLLHFKRRIEMNGGWWAVVKGIGFNTGFVAQTRPEPPSTGETQQPPPRFGQAPWGAPPFTLQVPRPSTAGRTVVAVSVMPPQ
jgi:hypothetical protein